MTKRLIMALIGEPASGKIAIAKHLVDRGGFKRVRMMEPVHRMLNAGFGLKDEDFEGDSKSAPRRELGGMSPQAIKTALGYEWGRRTVHSDLWANQFPRIVEETGGPRIVCDDPRFGNELQLVRDAGGIIVKVTRPSLTERTRELRELSYDYELMNDKGLEDLFVAADALVGRLEALRAAAA